MQNVNLIPFYEILHFFLLKRNRSTFHPGGQGARTEWQKCLQEVKWSIRQEKIIFFPLPNDKKVQPYLNFSSC
jgi:hypothetical protein